MAAGTYNFTIEQGVTLYKSFTWKDSVGNPVNLTEYTARMHCKDRVGGTTYLELSTTDDSISFPSPTTGGIQLYIRAATTAGLTQKQYVYDLNLYAPNGDVVRLLKGKIVLSLAVTI